MRKFVELLHWEYHSGKLERVRYYKKNTRKVIKNYHPKKGVERYVREQIDLLPSYMQPIARQVGIPKSIDLMFSVFTEHVDYILFSDELRRIVEIMIMQGFDSESVVMAIQQQPFSRNICVRDIERYKYFFWHMGDGHMKLPDIHKFMRSLDGNEDVSSGYQLHVDAFYHRLPMDYVMVTLGASSEDMMPSLSENTRYGVNAMAIRFKHMVRDPNIPLETLGEVALSFARMLRAYSTLERDDTASNLVDLLVTKAGNPTEKERQLMEAGADFIKKATNRKKLHAALDKELDEAEDAEFNEAKDSAKSKSK